MTDDEKRALRDAFGSFATGITVVTTRQTDGVPRGFTANSFTSVSLEPPLLLVCIAKSAHSCDVFAAASHFAVNVLSEEQRAVSGLFASRAPDKFEQAEWAPQHSDMPVLSGALSYFVCQRHDVIDAGDHLILIGQVLEHASSEAQPLGYFRGSYFSIGLEDSLVNAVSAGGQVSVGAILERDSSVLLQDLGEGRLCVPQVSGSAGSLEHLTGSLAEKGLNPQLDHLYAVYNDSETGRHGIYYHGKASGEAPDGMHFFALDALPLERIHSVAERSMLTRYEQEYKHGSFGIYQGDEFSGQVNRIAGRHPSKH